MWINKLFTIYSLMLFVQYEDTGWFLMLILKMIYSQIFKCTFDFFIKTVIFPIKLY